MCVCVECVPFFVILLYAQAAFFLPERQCAHPCDASLLAGERERERERERDFSPGFERRLIYESCFAFQEKGR